MYVSPFSYTPANIFICPIICFRFSSKVFALALGSQTGVISWRSIGEYVLTVDAFFTRGSGNGPCVARARRFDDPGHRGPSTFSVGFCMRELELHGKNMKKHCTSVVHRTCKIKIVWIPYIEPSKKFGPGHVQSEGEGLP